MEDLLIAVTRIAVMVIDAMALVTIAVGTVIAFAAAVRLVFSSPSGHEWRDVWLRYARWLVAGLTFQLAADIIESSVIQTWDAIGRLAAIAVIRTFLNYFLERDLREIHERQSERAAEAAREHAAV